MQGDNGPIREGFSSGESGREETPVRVGTMRVGSAKSLADFDSYRFFTPGLLYARPPGKRRVDPLRLFLSEYDKPMVPLTLRFENPVFSGMSVGNNPFWDHHLLAVEKDHWMPLMRWAATVSFFDEDFKQLTRIRPMLINIADPLYIAKAVVLDPRKVPLVEIGVWALDTSRGNVWLEDGGNPLVDRPRVMVSGDVFSDTGVFAEALRKGDDQPLRRVEESRLDPELGLSPSEAWLLKHYGDREPIKPPDKVVPISQLPVKEQEEIGQLLQYYKENVK